jgi:hypothetical protein
MDKKEEGNASNIIHLHGAEVLARRDIGRVRFANGQV